MKQANFKTTFRDINAFNNSDEGRKTSPFLKAHLQGGGLCIYTDTLWTFNEESDILEGNAELYNARRMMLSKGNTEIHIDSVVLFESNRPLDPTGRKSRITATTILTSVDAVFGVICLTVPKACWGSCPTFYTGEGDYLFSADAEGFSNAIIPSLEYGDIDALEGFTPKTRQFSIKMKNEALETHVVRDVQILALEREPGMNILHGVNDRFFLGDPSHTVGPFAAMAPEGDITELLSAHDQEERFSMANRSNMKTKEEVLLSFGRMDLSEGEELGLILNFRQTLMTTYLIYSVMGYMGNTVSDFLAELDKDNPVIKKHDLIKDELGGIEVYLMDGEKELFCGTFHETGPIAYNHQVLSLPDLNGTKEITFKLKMNQGLWRIDYAALTPLLGDVNPVSLRPEKVLFNETEHHESLEAIHDDENYLISMPGDEVDFYFSVPDTETEYDYFLYSKGYYLEWMRDHWLQDKNLMKLNRLIEKPDKFFRKEARIYSKYESEMENIFWNSRINTQSFSYHE